MIALGQNSYGKSRVRLVKVKRHPGYHELRDWTVEILLEGDFESCFVDGDNSKILPTDTMKNTVYSLARSSDAECIEDFAKELVVFLLDRNPQATVARASLSEQAWEHLNAHASPHPTTFVQSSGECQTAEVVAKRSATERMHVGSSPPAPDQRCMGNANKQIIVKKYPDAIQKCSNIYAVST